jgi:integrase
MAREIGKLSDQRVRRMTKPGTYGDGAGLYLRVGPSGSKSWIFRYRAGGVLHSMGLGAFHTIGLAEAREKARAQRVVKLDGGDPILQRRHERDEARVVAARAMTFKECAEAFIKAREAGWRSAKSFASWNGTLKGYALPVFGDLPVQAIDVALVTKVIEPLWTTKAETAKRLLDRIRLILQWAEDRGHRQKGSNPARDVERMLSLALPLTKAKAALRRQAGRGEHLEAMPYAELPAFMRYLGNSDAVSARALEFIILTGARTDEALGMSWGEIDLEKAVWVIPGSRTKTAVGRKVPLSVEAASILRLRYEPDRCRAGDRVFRVSDTMLRKQLRRKAGRGKKYTTHGMRTTVRTWAAEQTTFPSEIAEMFLGHVVGSAVERAYQRSDMFERRREFAEAWARFCEGRHDEGNIVPLRRSVG